MLVHSVIFDNTIYDTTHARAWLKKHKYYPIKRVDVTANYLRYRIRDPKMFKSFVTKDITHGIKLVLGIA